MSWQTVLLQRIDLCLVLLHTIGTGPNQTVDAYHWSVTRAKQACLGLHANFVALHLCMMQCVSCNQPNKCDNPAWDQQVALQSVACQHASCFHASTACLLVDTNLTLEG